MRDPHVQWCERRTPSVNSGGAVYSISGSLFFSVVRVIVRDNAQLTVLRVLMF